MPGFSWKKAKTLLTETEKDRLCCLILTCADQIKPTSAEFKVAAEEFDAAPGGFTKMYQTTIKKLKDNNAFAGTGGVGEGEAAAADGETEAAAPAPKPKTPRKRKSPATEGEGDGSVKKRGRPSKKAQAAAQAAQEEVKEEAVEEEVDEGGAVNAEAEVEA